ncbi:MAG: hypothetical protein LBJ64_05135 [Deltaproteobacteria bacterium]|jgi:ABC-type transport system involved in cytochrome c biogenesis ATPase subunit|nr:hypothetical protein [Deltaproteobacteria bacterium]
MADESDVDKEAVETPSPLPGSEDANEKNGEIAGPDEMDEPGDRPLVAFSWSDLTIDLPGQEKRVLLPNLRMLAGESWLAIHYDERLITDLARKCAGLSPCSGKMLWNGQAQPPENDYRGRLAFFRNIAYVSHDGLLVRDSTLLQMMCLDLEYNQGLTPSQARRQAFECLDFLGLSQLADLAPEKLVGPTKYAALFALAASRRPLFFIFERPLAILKARLFNRMFLPLRDMARRRRQAILVLGRLSSDYSENAFDHALPLGDFIIPGGEKDENALLRD